MTHVIFCPEKSGMTYAATRNKMPQYQIVEYANFVYNVNDNKDKFNVINLLKHHLNNCNAPDVILIRAIPELVIEVLETDFGDSNPKFHLLTMKHDMCQYDKNRVYETFKKRYGVETEDQSWFWDYHKKINDIDLTGYMIQVHEMGMILDDVSFFIWRILNNNLTGIEGSIVESWDGWDSDGSTSCWFYDVKLRREFFEQYGHIYNEIVNTGDVINMNVDYEHGWVGFSVGERVWEFTVKISLHKR